MSVTISNLTSSALLLPLPVNAELPAGGSVVFPLVEFDTIMNDQRFIDLVGRAIISVLSQDNSVEDLPLKASPAGADVVEIESAADGYAKRRAFLSSISGSVAHAVSHTDGTDQIANATQAAAGFMSAADKVVLDDIAAGQFFSEIRNETGGVLAKGTLVASAGWSTFHNRILVVPADKDNLTRQPVLGVVFADIANETDGYVLVSGPLENFNTSMWNPNDVLVLGNAGAFSLAPPDQSPFTGEIHVVGTVVRVSALDGMVLMLAPLPSMVNGPEVFALAGTSGTPGPANKYVTDLDPRLIDPPRYFEVASTGGDYTSIKSAIDAAVAAGATRDNPYGVRIYPGTYTEAPMTVPPGIAVCTTCANRIDLVYVVAQNPAQDLFTMTGGYINGIMATGVTDAAKACFRITGANVLATLHGVAVRNCSNGVVVSAGATCIFTNFSASILGAGQAVTTGIQCTGANSYVGIAGAFFSVPAALLAAYPGVNPIETCIKVQDSATAFFQGISAKVGYNTATADVLFADTTATATLMSSSVQSCNNAVHIGAAGLNTHVTVSACTLEDNALNVKIESATGVVFANFSTDHQSYSGVPGAQRIGTIQFRDSITTKFFGGLKYQFPTGKDADFADLIEDYTATGVCEGGVVTDAGGLNVTITGGDAWINRPVDEDAFWVEWTGDTIGLDNNTTNYVYYDSVSETLTHGAAAPGVEGVLLAVVVTRGGVIRYLHTVRQPIDLVQSRLYNYLADTRKRMSRTGMAVSAGTTARRIDVDPGSYYLALDIINYAGAADASFSAFYGTDGASEDTGVVDIDITNYDNAGAKAALGAGHYRCDTLHVSSDGRLCTVYGKVDHALEADAIAEPSVAPPTFVEVSSFPLAKLIVKEAVGITQILDIRPTTSTAAGSGGTIASHAALADLNLDGHPQYLLVAGTRPMSGALNMGGFAISNVGNVDGIDVSAHAVRHNPGGADALTIGNPVDAQIGGASADGVVASYARADHLHAIPTAAPVAIGTANDVGAASTGSRSDHVHAHGAQTVDTLHAAAVAGVSAGFISAADQAVLDALAAGHTLIAARNESGVPIPRNTLVASAGWSVAHDCVLLVVADKDDGDKRPAIGVVHGAAIPDATNGQVLISGVIEAIDTSLWAVTDQLVLGTAGAFSRPPPDVDPFTGEIQNVGSVLRVNAVDGKILFIPDGMNAVGSQEIFALVGTNGTPSKINKYVTDSDARNTNSRTPTSHAASHTNGTDQVASVTVTDAGFMTAADKIRLNGMADGATNLALAAVAPANVTKAAADVGVGATAARVDHKHDVTTAAPASGAVAIDGTATEGSSANLARADHIHTVTAGSPVAVGTANADGAATTFSRSNHVHAGLTRSAGDFASFTTKANPVAADVLLIEDSAAAGAKKYVTAGTIGPNTTIVEAVDTLTTGSATDTLILGGTSMTTTPAAGTWLVTLSGSIANNTNGATTYASIWYNGAQIASSERRVTRGTQPVTAAFCCQAKITVSGAIAVEGRWRTSAGTGTIYQRNMVLTRVG